MYTMQKIRISNFFNFLVGENFKFLKKVHMSF